MKIRKSLTLLLCGACLVLTGCNKQNNNASQTDIVQIAQNDYAGAFYRMTNVQEDVLEVMDILETHNYSVQSGNPEDYWADDNFMFLHFLPVYDEDLEVTKVLNENDNFVDINAYLVETLEQAGYSEISVVQKEKHNYRLSFMGQFLDESTWQVKWGTKSFDCQYDPATNSFLVTKELCFSDSLTPQESTFFEFTELDKGIYALQNGKERLYVVYREDGTIQEFYYSSLINSEPIDITDKLTSEEKVETVYGWGFNGSVYPVPDTENLYVAFSDGSWAHFFERIKETGEFDINETSLEELNDFYKSAVLGFYTKEDDSMYKRIQEINADWVMEADCFEQTVIYKDGVIKIMNTNPLTKEKNSFSVRKSDGSVPVETTETETSAETETMETEEVPIEEETEATKTAIE